MKDLLHEHVDSLKLVSFCGYTPARRQGSTTVFGTVQRNGTPTRKNRNHQQIWICWLPPATLATSYIDILLYSDGLGFPTTPPKKTSELRNEAERSFKQFDFNHDGTIDGGELMTCFFDRREKLEMLTPSG